MAEFPETFKNFRTVFLSVLLVAISVGNTLTLIILLRKTLRRRRGTIYLVTLSAADLLAAYTGALADSLDEFAMNPLTQLCSKFQVYLNCVSRMTATYIIVALTLERVVTVCWPVTSARRCKNKVAYGILSSIVVIVSAYYSHQVMGVSSFCRHLVHPLCSKEWRSHYGDSTPERDISTLGPTQAPRVARQIRHVGALLGERNAGANGKEGTTRHWFPNANTLFQHMADEDGCTLDGSSSVGKHPAHHAQHLDLSSTEMKRNKNEIKKSRQEVSRSKQEKTHCPRTQVASEGEMAKPRKVKTSIRHILTEGWHKTSRSTETLAGNRQELTIRRGRTATRNILQRKIERQTRTAEGQLVGEGNTNISSTASRKSLTNSEDTAERLVIRSKRRRRATRGGGGDGDVFGDRDWMSTYERVERKLKNHGYHKGDCGYVDFLIDIWPRVDLVIFIMLPQLIVVTANVALVYKVCFRTRWTFHLPSEDGASRR